MTVADIPIEWADLIDSLVPEILNLVIASWDEMSPPAPDEKEDDITIALCRALMQNRTARGLPFQVRTQVVELEPAPGEDLAAWTSSSFLLCRERISISVSKVSA